MISQCFRPRARGVKARPVTSQSLEQDRLGASGRDRAARIGDAAPLPAIFRPPRVWAPRDAACGRDVRPDSPELIFKEGRSWRLPPHCSRGSARASRPDRRLPEGSLWLSPYADSIAQGSDQADARFRRLGGADRPGRADVLSRRRDGAAERGSHSEGPKGCGLGQPASGDARCFGETGNRLFCRCPSEHVVHLRGGSSDLGAKARAGRQSTISFCRTLQSVGSRRSICARR